MVESGRISGMTLRKARLLDSPQWLPAERLGQMSMDTQLRPWLIGKSLLTLRLKSVCGERFGLRLVHQWTGLLDSSHQAILQSRDSAGFFRDVEMCCGEQVWVFAETVIPDSTLSLHPWLAELGDAALGETLSDLKGIERSPYEYAWLPREEALSTRALQGAEVKPAGLWARRSCFELRGAPLLVQELFMPGMGGVLGGA